MKSYILLIWEQIPEETSLYLIPDEVADKHIAMLSLAHNKIINVHDMNEGMAFLNAALDTYQYESLAAVTRAHGDSAEYVSLWAQYKWNSKFPIDLNGDHISKVYLSGFYL